MAKNTYLLLLLLPFLPSPGGAQVTVKTSGVYVYSWKGVPHNEAAINCDSINNPNLYFDQLPLFFFYADSSVALAYDDDYHSSDMNPIDPDYFVRNKERLNKQFETSTKRGGASNSGMYRSNGPGEVIAKLREAESIWNYLRVYYHFVARSPDTLWLTEISRPKPNGYVCPATGQQLHLITFSPALPFVFYPLSIKPDSSKADINKRRWARNP